MDKKILINILIGKKDENLLKLMDKKELKKLEETFERIKPTLDRLGKKETTNQDIENFIKLIKQNLIFKFINDLKWVDNKIFSINKEVAIKNLIKKYQKIIKNIK